MTFKAQEVRMSPTTLETHAESRADLGSASASSSASVTEVDRQQDVPEPPPKDKRFRHNMAIAELVYTNLRTSANHRYVSSVKLRMWPMSISVVKEISLTYMNFDVFLDLAGSGEHNAKLQWSDIIPRSVFFLRPQVFR